MAHRIREPSLAGVNPDDSLSLEKALKTTDHPDGRDQERDASEDLIIPKVKNFASAF